MPSATSLVHLLRERAQTQPDARAYTFLSGGNETESLTFAQLDRRARAIAGRLQALGARGERVLLLFPSGLDYVAAFYGCLAAGAVAVPAYPPRANHNLKRLSAILDDARPKVVMATGSAQEQLMARFDEAPGIANVKWLVTSSGGQAPSPVDSLDDAVHWTDPNANGDTLAFLQYTSASTSAPKGVMVTHGNVIHNQLLAKEAVQHGPETVIVSWLPLFHDMGLISIVLSSLYNGVPCYLLAPVDFLKKPRLWLEAISRYGGTFSGAPDFGYQLCVERVGPDERQGLDLSSWRTAFNGAEPIRADTLNAFADAFGSCGFKREAMFPCYGLAENTLFATGRYHRAPTPFSRESLEQHRPRISDNGHCAQLVSCGSPLLDSRVVIADAASRRRCGEDEVGEIWLGSPSVAKGYWNQPALSASTFRAHTNDGDGPFMRTGDLGFLHNGELFVTGRIKDLIIIRGRNLAPQDIELAVEQCDPAIHASFVAAVSVSVAGAEKLVIVAEVRREARRDLDTDALMMRIRTAVAKEFEVEVSAIALLKPNSLPKTSSGKTQRALVKQEFLARNLTLVAEWRDEAVFAPPPKVSTTRLEPWLVDRIAARTRQHPDRINRDLPLVAFGLDSLAVTTLVGEIEQTFGVELDVERLLAGEPSLKEVISRVASRNGRVAIGERRVAAPRPTAAPPPPIAIRQSPIAKPVTRSHPFKDHVNPELGRLLAQMGMDKTFVRGEGSWLWDERGRRYLDFLAQYGALPFGFNPPRIWAALNAVRESGEPSFVQPSYLDAAGELARRLIAVAPPGMAYVTYANSGAEAVEAAIKLCRSTTGRLDILAASNGFHGKTLGALSATDKEKYQKAFGAPVAGFDYVPYGDVAALRGALARGTYAAFLVEPIQGEGGIVEPPAGYLRQARKACREFGTLFVADEIQTGLGRTGAMFVCKELGITPDVMTVAKALGGGLIPIGACLSTAAAYNDEFALKHTSTFAGNTLACRAGIATLDLLEENKGALVAQVAENGTRLKEGLRALERRYPGLIGEVRGRGYLLGIRFGLNRHNVGDGLLGYLGEQEALTALVVSHLLDVEGIRVGYTLNQGGVLRIEPPLTTTWEECQYFLHALERVLQRIERRNLAALTSQVTGYSTTSVDAAALGGIADRRGRRPAQLVAASGREGRFAFLVHPLAWKDYGDIDGSLAPLSDEQLAALSNALGDNFDPLVVGETRVVGDNGKSAYGEFILVPRRAEELRAMKHDRAVAEIYDAAKLAQKRGAKIIGLGAYTSVVTQGGLSLKGNGLPPLTTGNSFTAVAARQAIRLAASERTWHLARRTIGIVGAGGAIGSALSVLLSRDAGRIVLIGNPAHARESRERLLQVAGRIIQSLDELRGSAPFAPGSVASWVEELDLDLPAKPGRRALVAAGEELMRRTHAIEISVDAAGVLPDVDVVVCCTSTTERMVHEESLRQHAVVCDISRPSNVGPGVRAQRPDVLLIDGGVVRMPGDARLGFNASLARGNAYACMAETMMLAMEQRYQDSGLGFDLALGQVLEMERLADELGFRVLLDAAERSKEDAGAECA